MTENSFVVLIVTDPITADIYKGLLESNGIPVFLRSDATRTVHPFFVGTLGDVEILVNETQLTEALALIDGVEIIIDESETEGTAEDVEPEEDV